MSNDVVAFKSWLDAYGQAWESRNAEAASALFAEHGTYQVTPFLEPLCGRKAIFDYWLEVSRTEENVRFGYENLGREFWVQYRQMVGVVCYCSPVARDSA
jgi:hypothetical protein